MPSQETSLLPPISAPLPLRVQRTAHSRAAGHGAAGLSPWFVHCWPLALILLACRVGLNPKPVLLELATRVNPNGEPAIRSSCPSKVQDVLRLLLLRLVLAVCRYVYMHVCVCMYRLGDTSTRKHHIPPLVRSRVLGFSKLDFLSFERFWWGGGCLCEFRFTCRCVLCVE